MLVEDTILGRRYLLYRARTAAETDGGHVRDRWYAREAGVGPVNTPASRPFGSRAAALDAVRDGSWDLLPAPADCRSVRRQESR